MNVLLETYKSSAIHEYITVERLSVHAVGAVPVWTAKK